MLKEYDYFTLDERLCNVCIQRLLGLPYVILSEAGLHRRHHDDLQFLPSSALIRS